LRGDVLVYVAQGNPLIDAKIAEKRRFQTGTSPKYPRDICCGPYEGQETAAFAHLQRPAAFSLVGHRCW